MKSHPVLFRISGLSWVRSTVFLLSASFSVASFAAVLPKERADVMFHSYDGGGVTINGPSVLVRKNYLDKYSVTANVYVDNITGASIDVEILASEYTEERTELSLGVDYLVNKTILGLGYTNSSENDYKANTIYGSVSQDFFGDLSSVSFTYSQGWDEVSKTDDEGFGSRDVDHQKYVLSLSQILTKKWLMNVSLQTDVDEGFLNNPYRKYSALNEGGIGREFFDEIYPESRTSDAMAIRFKRYMPNRAALGFEFRAYQDSWGIDAYNFDVNYTRRWEDNWIFEVHHRWYSQKRADFYSDIFAFNSQQNFKARDKELSTFVSGTLGIGATYEYEPQEWGFVEKVAVSLLYDKMNIRYSNFLDAREEDSVGAGNESKYSLEADIIRLFCTVWY
ncbi:MAG: hypothetical protein COA99_07520 [Moraxellaceae bacterium]|nr:MAG: hypothetical protein COA99_07520 [Moraxellaceae bacterium]